MIAALYVQTGGSYYGLDGVDPWDEARDARKYAGPWPVVAHPPCSRWCRLAGLVEARWGHKRGDDGGCFAAALASVREWGGVLEHPEASHAWRAFGLIAPMRGGGWSVAGDGIGWTCCVEQGAYGHKARKATWLYAVRCELPRLIARAPGDFAGVDGIDDPIERRRIIRRGALALMGKPERAATPHEFRDVLIAMARSVADRREVA